VLAGAPLQVVLGTVAALLAIGAAIYRPALGLAILAFTYPYDLDTYAGPVKLTTSYVLLAILVLVWAGREILPHAPEWRRTPLDWAVGLFAAATVLSILGLTGNYSDQLIALVKAAGGFALFFLVTQSVRERTDVWLLVGAITATGLIQAATTIFPVITGSVQVSDTTRAIGTLSDANLFAGYLVLVAALSVAAALAVRRRWSIAAAGLVTLVFGMALVATLSRSGWIGFLVALLTMAVLLPERRREIALVGAGVVGILVVIGLAGPIAGRLGGTEGGSPFETFFARVPIWAAAWAMFIQHPIFGIGVNNFGFLIQDYNADLDVNQAHNLFLNIAAERGILGIVTFLFVAVMSFRALRAAWRKAPEFTGRVLIAGISAAILGFLAHSLFDVSYYDYRILLMFWIVIGLAACSPRLFTRPA
jgi:putative inorganic carbon (HCO3(-)) transporter